jgi:hypothetical protein
MALSCTNFRKYIIYVYVYVYVYIYKYRSIRNIEK